MTPFSRSIEDYPEGIVLPIDKPYRWTSADVIRKIKYAAIRHFGKKNLKVGHAGTLDPLATGVLIVCIGEACKRAQQLQDSSKEYVATIRFGATTPSYDLEKDVDRTFPYEHITAESVAQALKSFIGVQEQVAPLFSAKSVDGVRAYELARKLYRKGETAQLDSLSLSLLQRNTIEISALELLHFSPARVGEHFLSAGVGQNILSAGVGEKFFDLFSGEKLLLREGKDILSNNRDQADSKDNKYNKDNIDNKENKGNEGNEGNEGNAENTDIIRRSASSRINVADTSHLGLPEAVVRISCSKGTYIRAFARDLGEALGSGSHLAALQRTLSGGYRIEDSRTLEEVLAVL